ncbi:uncharacterized protein BDR25DRAFT_226273 [Lindgomyces ingoldianus]|uniref:Uncharacterized protein n=1 Tax=Lindgomyces ingoldianus TaxID=673940 RepID=A0ACB6QTY2_9PLEO|nr:uncharacterized protein BDR25DRAFT_226273 [Lindgomyces ingoldianus]KAF2470459.1 hypothetical protein BDR25DRAFT_226273 [Lindgomyces ingoldianus]
MDIPIPSPSALRALRRTLSPSLSYSPLKSPHYTQTRNATLLRRPKRPYTFTQLVTLSDGSTFLHRTTSPIPVYRSTKDNRNTPLWNPSSQKLLNVEEDEAGRLRRFREKFGRGWDAEGSEGEKPEPPQDHLMDLISAGFKQDGKKQAKESKGSPPAPTPEKGTTGKK